MAANLSRHCCAKVPLNWPIPLIAPGRTRPHRRLWPIVSWTEPTKTPGAGRLGSLVLHSPNLPYSKGIDSHAAAIPLLKVV